VPKHCLSGGRLDTKGATRFHEPRHQARETRGSRVLLAPLSLAAAPRSRGRVRPKAERAMRTPRVNRARQVVMPHTQAPAAA